MPTFSYDAFVSYRDSDRPQVQLLINALQGAGLKVYWDQMNLPGQIWAKALEQAITTCRYTLLCVSPAAVTSSFIEAEIKLSHGKIIPVFLKATDLPLLWEATIGPIQRVDLSRSQFAISEPVFAQLCTIVSGRMVVEQVQGETTPEARARRLIEKSSIADLSLVVALSVLGGAAADDISLLARDFEVHFRALVPYSRKENAILMESLSTRLGRIGAEVFIRPNLRFGVKVDCARFVEPALGHAVLALAWSEYEKLRAPILNWIRDWSAQSPLWIRLRLALNLGILAQDERKFDAIWRLILKPMLFDNARRRGLAAKERFEVADAALSIAAFDPSRKSTVEAILNEMIAEQEGPKGLRGSKLTDGMTKAAVPGAVAPTGAAAQAAPAPQGSQPGAAAPADGGDPRDNLAAGGSENFRIYLVARLAFGFTGARYPDLALKALRRLADLGKIDTLEDILGESFRDAMSSAKGMTDGSLWDPIDMLGGLLRWAADVPTRDQTLPLLIFVIGLSDLPLASANDDHLSLTSIMRSERGLPTLRRGFLLGLSQPDTREDFEGRLREWRDLQRTDPVEPDPVLALAAALFHCASTEREKDRIKFIFRGHYDEAKLRAVAQQFPQLCKES